jgi:hypothetical protein
MSLSAFIATAHAQVTLLVPSVTGGAESTGDINSYLAWLFPQMIKIGALIAIIAITYEGIRMISTNIPGLKNLAKSHLWDAITGLALLLGAYLILQTINPNIFNVKFDPGSGGVSPIPSSAISTTPASTVSGTPAQENNTKTGATMFPN